MDAEGHSQVAEQSGGARPLAREAPGGRGAPLGEAEIRAESEPLRRLVEQVGRVVVGQSSMVERLVLGLLTGGHVLLEGVPGLAKTLTVSTLARGVRAEFRRIQFTPDLLPADLVGTLIYNPRDGVFTPRRGPIFANIVLADEINRAPAKVQSALLEAMQEKRVTIGDATHDLPRPFLVLATQNPIEQEGTYALPEAQVDRFMFKLKVGYPSKQEERTIVDRMATTAEAETVVPVITPEEILRLRGLVDRVAVDPRVRDYVVDIVHATRDPRSLPAADAGRPERKRRGEPGGGPSARGGGSPDEREGEGSLARLVEFGASPRASIALVLAAKAHAFVQGRGFVTPSDVKSIALDVLRHRVIVTYEAEAEGVTSEDVVRRVLDRVVAP